MEIGIIGASGKSGNYILKEALNRGHHVTVIVRDASKITDKEVIVLEKDLFNLTSDDLKPFDVVVNAFKAAFGQEQLHVEAGKVLIEALKEAPDTKLIVVGGAGSLFIDSQKTTRVMDTPNFPEAILPIARNMGKNLEDLQNSTFIKWTYISPSAIFDPQGKRTGSYQLGKDQLLVNASGKSYVSYADYAIAVLDEIESPKHLNKRFTVGSEIE